MEANRQDFVFIKFFEISEEPVAASRQILPPAPGDFDPLSVAWICLVALRQGYPWMGPLV